MFNYVVFAHRRMFFKPVVKINQVTRDTKRK